MAKQFTCMLMCIVVLTGCYCEHFSSGTSSVRFLRGNKAFTICYQPPPLEDGKKVLVTAYAGDPYLQQLNFRKREGDHIPSDITYTPHGLFGLRAESFFYTGSFPGPLLGMGVDYSFNRFSADYTTLRNKLPEKQEQDVKQQRLNFSINFVTWIRPRMMGYITAQPGCEWTKKKIESEFTQFNFTDKAWIGKFNYRVGYGFQFYIRPLLEFNLELGYGGGAFVKGGIGLWVF
jgi:hypothetical protein